VTEEKHTLSRDKKVRESEKNKDGETEQKHTQTKDKKARDSEQGKDRKQRKSMHFLETRRQGKVSKTRMGDRGKAHTS
jgi:hypothetical protein